MYGPKPMSSSSIPKTYWLSPETAFAAVGAGTLSRDDVAEIQELVTGTVPGRTNPDLLTFFKSVGTGLQDITVAYYAYRRAKEQGLGIEIPDFVTVKDLQQ